MIERERERERERYFSDPLHGIRYDLSLVNLEAIFTVPSDLWEAVRTRTYFLNADVTSLSSFSPFTHIYSFDVGFPADVMLKIASIFNKSVTAIYYCSFHTPGLFMSYGFDVTLVGNVTTSMHGSGERHSMYVYKRNFPEGVTALTTPSVPPPFVVGFSLLRSRLPWWSRLTSSSPNPSRLTRLSSSGSLWECDGERGEGEGGGEGGGDGQGERKKGEEAGGECDVAEFNLYCHQCVRKNPMSSLLFCSLCPRRYCIVCLRKSYPPAAYTAEGGTDWVCVGCQGVCACAWGRGGMCMQHPMIKKEDTELGIV